MSREPARNATFRPESGPPTGESTVAVSLPLPTASATARLPDSPPSTSAPRGGSGGLSTPTPSERCETGEPLEQPAASAASRTAGARRDTATTVAATGRWALGGPENPRPYGLLTGVERTSPPLMASSLQA